MTLTALRSDSSPASGGAPSSNDADRSPAPPPPAGEARWPIAAEVCLALVSVAAVLGLSRLFSDGSFIIPAVSAALFSHSVASVGRHARLSPILAGLISALAVLLITAWVVEPTSTTFGLPLESTWRAIGNDLHDAWARFNEVRAPTPVVPGFLAAAACGAGLAAALADGLAFRARARFEALAPSFTLFMFGGLLGSDHYRILSSAIYFGAVVAFVIASRPTTAQPWFNHRARQGDAALLRGGLAVGSAAVLLAVVVGPQLPGAHTAGLVGLGNKDDKGSSSRVTVSPLVDIRNRLVEQSNLEMFTVKSGTPSYWRLTSLSRFDGTIWSSLGSYQPASGDLGSSSGEPGGTKVDQTYAVSALSSIWLPAAFRANDYQGPKGIRFDSDSASLLTDAATSDGLQYKVTSVEPNLDAARLEQIPNAPDSELTRRYLELPASFPDRVHALAEQVTASEQSPFGKAKALQDWFRSNFTYDLNVPAGHDVSAIERFLFVTRRGYCEQFAGSFAAMARSLGIPARVAVGFTTGDQAADGTFDVSGKDAHAWPEIYLVGAGWVALEPTPGRANPNASYSGVNPSPAADNPATPPSTTVPTTEAPGAASAPTTAPPTPNTPTTSPAKSTRGGGFPTLALAIALAVLILAAYVIGLPLTRRRRRARLELSATTPTAEVLLAWRLANEDLNQAGIRKAASETATEFAARVGSGIESSEVSSAIVDLAEGWTVAAYSSAEVGSEEGARAKACATRIRTELDRSASRLQRLLWDLDPRPLLRRSRRA